MNLRSLRDHPHLRPFRRIINDFRLNGMLNAGTGSLCLEINSPGIGFFAQLTWCLNFLAFCEQREIHPLIRLTGPPYASSSSHDWFHDFFEDINPLSGADAKQVRPLVVRHIDETTLSNRHRTSLTLEDAHRLFHRYFRAASQIQSHVDRFVATEFSGNAVIGLHFRGTDKKSEAQPVEWQRCFRSVMKLAQDLPQAKKVFVASDDSGFIDWFVQQANGSLSVVAHPDSERSRGGKPAHLDSAGDPYRKGFEALANSLLLSRCTALIRTVSFLSGWSSIFNPHLPITVLNRPYEYALWFPDRECLQRSDNRYL